MTRIQRVLSQLIPVLPMVVLFHLVACQSAFSQKLSIEGHSGLSVPLLRDVGWDYRRVGFNAALGAEYFLSGKVSLVSQVSYGIAPFDEEFFDRNVSYVGFPPNNVKADPNRIMTAWIGGRIYPVKDSEKFYLTGLFGLYHILFPAIYFYYDDRTEARERADQSGTAFHVGMGRKVAINPRWSLSLEGMYQSLNYVVEQAFDNRTLRSLHFNAGVHVKLAPQN